MVHPAFDIKNDNTDNLPDDCKLLIEVSGQFFNYILFSRLPDQLFVLRQYRIYTTGDKSTRDVLEDIISGDPVLEKYASKAIIVYNFPDANIVPSEYFKPEIKNAITKLMHGDTASGYIFDEEVRHHNMQMVYSVSKDLHSLCRERFQGGSYWHLYTLILLLSFEETVKNMSRVIFYSDKFVVACFCEGQLQLLQTFSYQTPEDAAYYLLLICKQTGIVPGDMVLNISGLIDTQSALYTELLKYFSNVSYEGIPESYGTNGLLEEYPAHYFSPLIKMSLCV